MPGRLSGLLRRFRRRTPPSRPETADADLERFFTDAEEARAIYERLLAAEKLARRILVIHGAGAVGKSSLLKMYRLSSHRQGVPVALVGGEDAPSAVDLLDRCASDLDADAVELPTFASSLAHYRQLQAKVESEALRAANLQADATDQLTKAAARGIAAAAGVVPFGGTVAAIVGPEGIEAALNLIRATLSREDYDFFTDPTRRLTDDFLLDVGRTAERRRLVLMLDTFEQVAALSDWLRDLVQRLHENVLVVIAGREIPEWDRDWPGWIARREAIELTEMTDEQIETLVRQYYALFDRGEPDDEFVRDVVRFARGLPMAATTAVRLQVTYRLSAPQPAGAGIAAELADQVLEGVPAELRPAFEAAAVLRQFNADSLGALVEGADGSRLYDELRRWPFTRARREGLAVHETMREVINGALAARSPDRFRRLNELAAAHYEQRLSRAGGEEADRVRLEWLYHSLRADEATGLRGFREWAENLVRAQWISRLRALVTDADMYPLGEENSRLWRRYYAARLEQLVGHTATAESEYSAIAESAQAEASLRAYALCDLGTILASLDRLAEPDGERRALAAVERSLKLQPQLDSKLVENHITRMKISNARAAWDESIRHVEEAREFARANDDPFALVLADRLRAGLYGLQGDWRGYLRTRRQYVDVLSGLGDVPALRMQVAYFTWPLTFMGRYAEALASSEEALELAIRLEERELMITIRESIALALGMQESYAEASPQFDEAHNFYENFHRRESEPESGSPERYIRGLLSFRGLVALREGRLDQATADLDRALAVKREIGDRIGTPEVHVWRGQLRELRSEWDEAAAEYDEALKLREVGRTYFHCAALVGLVRVRLAQRRFEECGPPAAEADELASRLEYNDLLASLRLSQGHLAWEGGDEGEAAVARYRQALLFALRFNRFLLDEVLGRRERALQPSVIAACLNRGEQGRRSLSALREWWETGTNDGDQESERVSPLEPGVPLLEAERTARAREPGDGGPQTTVIQQLESALAGV